MCRAHAALMLLGQGWLKGRCVLFSARRAVGTKKKDCFCAVPLGRKHLLLLRGMGILWCFGLHVTAQLAVSFWTGDLRAEGILRSSGQPRALGGLGSLGAHWPRELAFGAGASDARGGEQRVR